ncbi:HupE/UreJ family protein [Hoeflea sp. CAU 1731]
MKLIIAIATLLAVCLPAKAHFSEDVRSRTILVAVEDNRTVAYVQIPAPLVFADLIVRWQRTGEPLTSSLLVMEQTGATQYYRLASEAVADSREELARRVERSLIWRHAGGDLSPRVTAMRLIDRTQHRDFSRPSDIEEQLALAGAEGDPLFGEALVEARIVLSQEPLSGTIDVRSGFPAIRLDPIMTMENVIIDARQTSPVAYVKAGQLVGGVAINGSRLYAFRTFLLQGVRHIAEGPDHVLLVVAIALAVGVTWNLFWMVSAFTVGHSITLIASFSGLTPQWFWFIPAVETAIAVSVLYAAISALAGRAGSPWVFGLIGLLHGLGFSFVLTDILGPSSPHLTLSLVAFNIGIELGQITILAIVLATVALLFELTPKSVQMARLSVLLFIAAVSGWWIALRVASPV